jgi:hypothetical protein
MSTITGGTTATTTLIGVVRPSQAAGAITHYTAADLATINNAIRDDNSVGRISKGGFRNGILHIPGRQGYIKVNPGDYVFVDPNGWPILVSAYSIATGGWTHT